MEVQWRKCRGGRAFSEGLQRGGDGVEDQECRSGGSSGGGKGDGLEGWRCGRAGSVVHADHADTGRSHPSSSRYKMASANASAAVAVAVWSGGGMGLGWHLPALIDC